MGAGLGTLLWNVLWSGTPFGQQGGGRVGAVFTNRLRCSTEQGTPHDNTRQHNRRMPPGRNMVTFEHLAKHCS
jgi:hypothetical protein